MAKRIQKKTKKIQLLVADTLSAENNIVLPELIALLPSNFQYRAHRYKNKRSSVNYCFGRLMLMRAIVDLGFEKEMINQLYFSENDKPLIDGLHFSISHSENIVGLAYSKDFELGLDIERINKEIDLNHFKSFFRDDEWKIIKDDENPIEKFYWFWVRKESILKAEDGKMNQVKDIFITSPGSGGFRKEKMWYFNELKIAKKFLGVVACEDEKMALSTSFFHL